MSKIDKITRDKVIEILADYTSEGFADDTRSGIQATFKELLMGGSMRPYTDYTDQELYKEFNEFFEDQSNGEVEFQLKQEMEAQLAIEGILEESSG